MAAIGQLAAGIAHEITTRSPSSPALYDLSALLQDPSAEVREDLRSRCEMARAQEIISKPAGVLARQQTEVQAVDLNALIERTLKLMNKYLQNNGCVRRACSAQSGPRRQRERMRQVLLNLITNAVQAMPKGGERRSDQRDPARPRPAVDQRHRRRHSAAAPGADLRSVLHHQGARRRDWPRPVGGALGRQERRRHDRGAQHARSRHDLRDRAPLHQPAFMLDAEESLPRQRRGRGR
jgi:hypothetical protein